MARWLNGPMMNFPMNYLVIADLFLLLFVGLADNQTIPALLPTFSASLHAGVRVTGLLVVFYSLAAALAAFLVGSLSDYYGRRRFLQLGALLFAVASGGASLSRSFTGLAVARGLTGLAAGTLSTCSIAFAGDWFPYTVRGRAIGWIASAYFVAPLSVPLAAFVADRMGWHRVFTGFALLAVMVSSIALTLPKDQAAAPSSKRKLRNTLDVFRSFLLRRDTSAMLGIAFLVSGGLVGFITYIGQWLHGRFGLTATGIGLVFMLGGVIAVAGAPLGGAMSDRWGKRTMSISSNVLLAIGVLLMPFLPWGVGLLTVFAAVSLSAAFRQGPLTALMTEMVPQAQRGSFVALRNICSQLGIGAAVFAGGVLYQHYGYAAVTLLCAVMTALVAILLATHIVEPQPVEEDVPWGRQVKLRR